MTHEHLQCLKVEEVADLLCVCQNTVRKLISSGHLRHVMVGKSRRVLKTELERYLGVTPEHHGEGPEVEVVELKDKDSSERDDLSKYADRWKLNLRRRREG